jgi:hypothetical protein
MFADAIGEGLRCSKQPRPLNFAGRPARLDQGALVFEIEEIEVHDSSLCKRERIGLSASGAYVALSAGDGDMGGPASNFNQPLQADRQIVDKPWQSQNR